MFIHRPTFSQSPIYCQLLTHFRPVSYPTLKESIISPLLVKPTLDKELSSYRPISNLSLISKIIERVVKSRLMDHLTSNSLLNSHQSAYCKHHSTETALLYIHDHRRKLLLGPEAQAPPTFMIMRLAYMTSPPTFVT